MQTLNLAMKLFQTDPHSSAVLFKVITGDFFFLHSPFVVFLNLSFHFLCQFVMELCKYDMNYDLRDRARLFRALFFKKKGKEETKELLEVKDQLKAALLVAKPTPHVEEPFQGLCLCFCLFCLLCLSWFLFIRLSFFSFLSERQKFTLGTLSHLTSASAPVRFSESIPSFLPSFPPSFLPSSPSFYWLIVSFFSHLS
jgi:hypothetical protein